jgi:hypothetical protein
VTVHLTQQTLDDFDLLAGEQRQGVLQHARTCAACRIRLVSEDPGRLFALLSTDPLPEVTLDRLSERIQAGLVDRPEQPRTNRGWFAVAAIAASLVFVILVGVLSSRQAPLTELTELTELPELNETSEPALATVTPIEIEAAAAQPAPMHSVELISSPGEAQLVDFTIGDIQVVMIIDRELDI